MLVRRHLSLGVQDVIHEPIVRREHFADALMASQLIESAQEQAQTLLAQTQSSLQTQLDEALEEFWQKANGVLQVMEAERQALQDNTLAVAEELLTLAMGQLLEGTSFTERIAALLQQLGASQAHANPATLSCHPDILAQVEPWLANSKFARLWQLQSELSMPLDALRLNNASGAFDIDWPAIKRGLLAQKD